MLTLPHPRVEVLALDRDHIRAVVEACRDWPELARFGAPYWRPRSAAELERKIVSMAGPGLAQEYNFVVTCEGALVGECSVHSIDYRNRVGQVGVCIWDRQKRCQGLGQATLRTVADWAQGHLGLRRLEAWIVDGNAASEHMVERIGFQREGTMRGRYLCDGQFLDVHVYSLVPDKE